MSSTLRASAADITTDRDNPADVRLVAALDWWLR